MIRVGSQEAESQLSALLVAVERGETVIICRAGKPIAYLRRVQVVEDPVRQNPALQGVVFREDPTAPLEPSDWPEAYA